MPISEVISIAGCMAVALAFANWFVPKVITYSVDEAGVARLWLRRFRCNASWDQISEVDVQVLPELIFDGEATSFKSRWWNNRVAWRYVVLRCRNGRMYVLSPRAPEEFASRVSDRVQALGRGSSW